MAYDAGDSTAATLHFVYSRSGVIVYNTYEIGSSVGTERTWGTMYGYDMNCALSPDGDFYFTHSDISSTQSYVSTFASGSFVKTPLGASTGSDGTALVIDSSGTFHVLYDDYSASDLEYVTMTPSGSVSSPVPLDSTGSVGSSPAMAMDSAGTLHVVYRDDTNQTVKYMTNSGGTWSSPETVASQAYHPSLAVDSDNAAHIAYLSVSETSYYDVKHAAKGADGTWVIETVDDDHIAYSDTSIITTSPDAVHVSYRDEVNGALKYATNVRGEWSATAVASGSVGNKSTIAADANGNVYIAYTDDAEDTVKLAFNVCGDGVLDESEECDGEEGCSDTCEYNCGNETVDPTEECDDGNSDDNDACTNACLNPVCGDGKIWNAEGGGAEECDDDGTTDGDGCSASCAMESGYECTGTPSVCATRCGDGVMAGTEACDGGEGCTSCAAAAGYTCSSTGVCTTTCGDGITAGTEACDGGEGCTSCSAATGYTCSSTGVCTTTCGDGIMAGTEACDDNNTASGDGCTSACVDEFCGDSVDNDGALETCDDGDTDTTDSCPASCVAARCGDGYFWSTDGGTEECDDGDADDHDGCTNSCTAARCGDSILWNTGGGTETCDDGDNIGGIQDGCDSLCRKEYAPLANAGRDLSVTYGTGSCGPTCTLFYLDGRASTDPDLDKLTYSWAKTAQPLGSTVGIASPTYAKTAVRVNLRGTYVFTLTVTDADGYTATDTVQFTVR